MSPERIPLASIATIVQGGRHGLSGNHFVDPRNGYPAFGAGGLNGYLATYEFDQTAIVLSSIGARCGKCFLATGRWSSLANTQVILPDTARVDVRFLWYQLNDERSWLRSGTAQPFIKPSTVKSRAVLLPPLPEQRRIADILDKADAIRRKRKEMIALTEELLRSAFLEMFGDPATNPKGWRLCKMADLCVHITDGTHLTPKFESFGVPFLFVKNVRNGRLSFDTDKFISQTTYLDLTRRCPIDVGDVLYVTVGATYGDAVLVESDTPFCFQRHLAHLKPDLQKTRPIFLHSLLRSSFVKRQADRRVRGAAQPTLNLGELRDFDVYMPPLEIQVRFEEAASAIRQARTSAEDARLAADELFKGLVLRSLFPRSQG